MFGFGLILIKRNFSVTTSGYVSFSDWSLVIVLHQEVVKKVFSSAIVSNVSAARGNISGKYTVLGSYNIL